MDVSIPSVQLKVSPVETSDMFVLETNESSRKTLAAPGSR